MIVQEINQAKEAMDHVKGDYSRLNTLYNQLFHVEKEKKELDNTGRVKRFFIHFIPIGFLDQILKFIFLPFGKIGITIWEICGLAMIGAILYYTIRFDQSPYYKRKLSKINEKKLPLEKEIDELSSSIENYLISDDRVSIIPTKYRFPDAVDFFHEVINVGRASDLKEAMNLYEVQLHQWRLEDKNQEMVELQKVTLDEAAGARRASTMAAAFSMAALLSKD